MKNLCTSINGETTFSVSVLETGWIYDVFLILTDKIRSKYEEREFKKVPAIHIERKHINKKMFSVFEASYQFEQPSDMVYFFIYSIEGITYRTDPVRFTVEDY